MEASPSLNFALLEKYLHITNTPPEHTLILVPATDLWKMETMKGLMEVGRVQYKATSRMLPASFLGLSLFSLCGALHYAAATHNEWLDLSLDNLNFFLESHRDHIHAGYQVKEVRMRQLPEPGRVEALREAYEQFFTEQFNRIVDTIAEVAEVKPDMIWNQYAARLTYMQDFLLESERRPEVIERLMSGYQVLTEGIEPSVFNRRRNPFRHLKPVYLDSPHEAGKKVLLRSSCCMYYCREGGELCYNCPRMTESERLQRKEKIASGK